MKDLDIKKSAKLVRTATKEKSMSSSGSWQSNGSRYWKRAPCGPGDGESLEYQKVCVHWVPDLLTEEQNL